MNRTITTHEVEGAASNLVITVLDEKGAGGAHHVYAITEPTELGHRELNCVEFQNGPIKEQGVNGLTQEVLLAILIDRLECFQAGPFSTEDNAQALEHCKHALSFLQERTRKRVARGVEGLTKA